MRTIHLLLPLLFIFNSCGTPGPITYRSPSGEFVVAISHPVTNRSYETRVAARAKDGRNLISDFLFKTKEEDEDAAFDKMNDGIWVAENVLQFSRITGASYPKTRKVIIRNGLAHGVSGLFLITETEILFILDFAVGDTVEISATAAREGRVSGKIFGSEPKGYTLPVLQLPAGSNELHLTVSEAGLQFE